MNKYSEKELTLVGLYPKIFLTPIRSHDKFFYKDLTKINDMSEYTHQNATYVGNIYHGMGHDGVVFKDDNGDYHSLILGGSSGIDRFLNGIFFELYLFDQPTKKASDVSNDTIINFQLLNADKETINLIYELQKQFKFTNHDDYKKFIETIKIEYYNRKKSD